MSLRERIHNFRNKGTVEDMYHLASKEIAKGGVLNVEIGRGKDRRFLNITLENFAEKLPTLFGILKDPQEIGNDIKFTVLNREHKKTSGFSGKIKRQK